ncbi:biotin--[acetyl-CoA-carboxylase] ligase [Eubacteriales bacterium KG127]
MGTRSDILQILMDEEVGYHSGQELGKRLNVSRNAVWKAIEQLRDDGYDIESRPRVGYRLVGGTHSITESSICGHIKSPCKLYVFDTVESTNDFVSQHSHEIKEDKPLLVVANKQTSGRGRMGRKFFSPPGTGLYMSIGIKPKFAIDKALYTTIATAIAVCHAIEEVAPVKARVKWVNDIFLKNKKVCGILTEAAANLETGKIDKIIIGIGINCFAPAHMPDDIKNIAGAVSKTRNSFSRNELAGLVFENAMKIFKELEPKENNPTAMFETPTSGAGGPKFLQDYRLRSNVLGKKISIYPHQGAAPIAANAIDIDDNGGLVVEYMEGPKMRQIESLTTGEISIRVE